MSIYMSCAIKEARKGISNKHGGPFGAIIVNKDGDIVGVGHNKVLINIDPTCHGEVMAIRDACKNLKTHDLSGCVIYTTGYPCKMCMGAIEWANIKKVYYACNLQDTENIGFRDDFFYNNSLETIECDREEGLKLYEEYLKTNPTIY